LQHPIPFGKYVLLERISVGGMAEVFKAKTFGLKGFARIVAIKRILPQLAEDSNFVDMFIAEAKTAVELNHPNLCQVFDLGIEGNDHYIAMEYIEGKDLLALHNFGRRTRTRIPVHLVAYIGARIAEGLDYAHRRKGPDGESLGIVHRDVSPQNVIVTYDGGVKLIDFGIAKARAREHKETQAGVLKGKFGYMSPEQIDGARSIDHRSDIFALGTVVHELLTGKRLFLGDSDFATLEKVRNATFEPASATNPDVPPELDAILARALTRSPDERYGWASEMAEDLVEWLHRSGHGQLNTQLGDWMRTQFAQDLEREKARNELYAQIVFDGDAAADVDADESIDQTRADAPPALAAQRKGPEAVDEGDEETQLWEPLDEPEPNSRAPKAAAAPPATPTPRSAGARPPSLAEVAPVQDNPSFGLRWPPLQDRASGVNTTRRDVWIGALLVVVAGLAGVAAYRALDAAPDPVARGTVVVRVEPGDDLTLYLDNQVVGTASPLVRSDVSAGMHTLRVEKDGYVSHQSTVEVSAGGMVEREVRLEAFEGGSARLTVRLNPPDALLRVDGRLVTATEISGFIEVPSGRAVLLEATHDGHQPFKQTLKFDAGSSQSHALVLTPLPASLFVDSVPPGEVHIDGVHRGRAPLTLQDLDPTREYAVRITRPGFRPHEERLRFGPRRTVQLEPRLEPLDAPRR
jgi:hypothetical protein